MDDYDDLSDYEYDYEYYEDDGEDQAQAQAQAAAAGAPKGQRQFADHEFGAGQLEEKEQEGRKKKPLALPP